MSLSFRQLKRFDVDAVVDYEFEFDLSGTVYTFGTATPQSAASAITLLPDYLQMSFDVGPYASLGLDLETEFATARWFYGQSFATTSVGPNNAQSTSVFVDNGIRGTDGSDLIADPQGNNVVHAGDGDDLVMLGAGNDGVMGGDGADKIFSGGGNDTVDGGRGADLIYLLDGDDLAKGGGGRDQLYGEAGADRLFGNGGRDLLDGGADNDVLTGGGGADTFVFRAGSGEDIITDFNTAQDTIRLEASTGVTDFAGVTGAAVQLGDDLVLRLTSGDDIVLENVRLADLSADQFDFV